MTFSNKLSPFFFIPLLLIAVILSSCDKPSAEHWLEFVPQSTFFVIIPESESTLDQVLANPLMPILDDITPSVMQLITTIQNDSPEPLRVDALLLHPSSSDDWEPVWITKKVDGLSNNLASRYQREYAQNQYQFKDFTIDKIFITDQEVYMVTIGDWILFSESSFSLESSIRSLNGTEPKMNLDQDRIQPGSFIVNTENMGRWAQQLTQALYRPFLNDTFKGVSPIIFQSNTAGADNWEWQLNGELQLMDSTSTLVDYLSEPASEFSLDRMIPSDAAAYSLLRVSQQTLTETQNSEANYETDRFILNNRNIWHTIEQNLENEVALVLFDNSGPSSSSEYLFLRSIRDSSSIQTALDQLVGHNLIIKDEMSYSINSALLGKLFGSEISPVDNFYVTIYNRFLAVAERKGLAESIGGDAARRRVISYDDGYTSIRNSLPRPLSSIHYIDAPSFSNFIQPWLSPQHYADILLNNLDEFVIATRRDPERNIVDVSLTSFKQETEVEPYTEQWVFPLGGSNISGKSVLANITGSERDEVVFSTENGYVYALATDGTVILQASTGEDTPIGSPVVYDWYGNNQNIIMQAAGNKIYAWNPAGTILPNFPVQLDEDITTPLTITDVTGNGVAEMIVATADRNTHILNARGQPVNGWPQSTNSLVEAEPLIAELNNQKSLFAFSENTLHAWNIDGQRRDNYPVFLTAQLQGSPYLFQENLLGSALDGNLYSIGPSALFADTLASLVSSEFPVVQSLQISNSSLNTTPSHHQILTTNDQGEFQQRIMILLQSSNGSVFLYDGSGRLYFTESMGQPSSSDYPPVITDINGDDREDVIALADFGRLYAWDILSGERHTDLPTSAMTHPVISDFLGNGKMEIIAQTREGLQCWTINYTSRESLQSTETAD